MSNKRKLILAAVLAAVATAAAAAAKCQIDDMNLQWLGETTIEGGRMFKIMECVNGHRYLVRM